MVFRYPLTGLRSLNNTKAIIIAGNKNKERYIITAYWYTANTVLLYNHGYSI